MKLTGKSLEQFKKWVGRVDKGGIGDYFDCLVMIEDEPNNDWDIDFYNLPFSMQYGVLVDFFDSVGIEIFTYKLIQINQFSYKIGTTVYFGRDNDFNTRPEARAKAIEKANEILNNR